MLRLIAILLALAPGSDDPARELVRRIASALTPRETVAISVRNASQMTPTETAETRRAIESQLRAIGFRSAANATASIAVTLSENGQGRLWIAEIRHGEKRDVVMTVPQRAPERVSKTPVAIERQLILEQADPILDAAVFDNTLLVLEPAEVVIYRRQETRWERQQSLPILRNGWPRDVRGRLQVSGAAFQAFLPGMVCSGKLESGTALECSESDAPWPGGGNLAKGRNYFEAAGAPPFYSVARIGETSVLAGLNGRTRVMDAAMQTTATLNGWGSDVVGVEIACGRYVLATRGADEAEGDAVQAFEIVGRQPSAASAAVEFAGPIVTMWPVPPTGALAVSRDRKTGQYAAFRITATCSR